MPASVSSSISLQDAIDLYDGSNPVLAKQLHPKTSQAIEKASHSASALPMSIVFKNSVNVLRDAFDSKETKRKKALIKALRNILEKLEKKEDRLLARLKDARTEKDAMRNRLRLRVCAAQRKKGEKALAKMTPQMDDLPRQAAEAADMAMRELAHKLEVMGAKVTPSSVSDPLSRSGPGNSRNIAGGETRTPGRATDTPDMDRKAPIKVAA